MASLDGNWDKIVPCVSHSAINKPYWAPAGSGGGGGGGGPDLTVSSITVNELGQIELTLNSGNGAAILFDTDNTGAAATYQLFEALPPYGVPGPEVPENYIPSLVDEAGNFGTLQVSGIVFDGNGEGSTEPSAYIKADPTGLLNVWSAGMNISSLTVSSINGASPGGGSSGPNPQVSSIIFGGTLGGGSVLDISNPNVLAITNGNTSALTEWSFSYSATATGNLPAPANIMGISSPDGNTFGGMSLCDDGKMYLECSSIKMLAETLDLTQISTLSTTSLQVSTINSGSLGTLAIGGSVSVFNQLACSGLSTNTINPVSGTNVTISSILVSTINGAEYPPTSSVYPYISSIKPGGGGGTQTQYFCSTNSEAQVLTTFDTVLGHNYQLNLPFFISTFNTPIYGDALLIGSVGAGATDLIYTLPLIQGATWNVPLVFKNTVTDGPVQVLLGTNTTYPIEVNLNSSAGAELIDLGPSQ